MRFHSFAFWAFFLPGFASALGLGDVSGRVVIGESLAVRVSLQGPEAGTLKDDCVKLLAVPGDTPDSRLDSAWVKVDNGAVLISSHRVVSQPVLSFRVRIDCGMNLVRDYQLLPLLPQRVGDAPPAPVAFWQPKPVRAHAAEAQYTVRDASTLRLISRQRYPLDAAARVAFIRRVAAANPEIFESIEVAFDQPLPPGMQLRMPANLPKRDAASSGATRALTIDAPVASRAVSIGKGRLTIGAGAPPTRSVEDLEADIDRLVGIMNEQMLIQISMAERLGKLELELEKAKQAMALQQGLNQRLEADVRTLREEQRFNSYVQLILAILLGGSVVAAFLLWRGQMRSRDEVETPIHVPTTPRPAASPKVQLQSVFDDLLPPK